MGALFEFQNFSDHGPQVEFVRPGIARLRVQHPVAVGDVIGIQDAVAVLQRITLGEVAADELGVDGAIDHDVRDVNALRAQLARHRLGQRAQCHLCARESTKVGRAAQRCRRTGEDDRAAMAALRQFARHHALGHFAPVEKAREAGHLPHLEVFARGLGQDALGHVGADVEHHHLDGPDRRFDLLDERDHFLFLARIAGKGMGAAAIGLDLRDQRLQLV
jgi:hypothetical protein